jgi:hypothetical protein
MSSTSEVPAEAGAQRTPEPAFTPGRGVVRLDDADVYAGHSGSCAFQRGPRPTPPSLPAARAALAGAVGQDHRGGLRRRANGNRARANSI